METEFNQPPEGFEGKQKRRTEFASIEEKLQYDAKNLIAMARAKYGRDNVTVRDALDLASRKDDDIEALRKVIAIETKTKPQYEQFIDGLNLIDGDKEKLKEMMSPASYERAVATAKEDTPQCTPPTHAQIAKELMGYSEERLRDICEMMEKPTLLIVTPKGLDERLLTMNEHKHYTSADNKSQKDAHCDTSSSSPYKNAPKASKGKVSIVNGIVHPKQLTRVLTKLGARRTHLTQTYAAKGMRNVDKDEMATLLQQSLREAKAANDNSLIVDNGESGYGTVTILDSDSLTESSFVAYAGFDSVYRRVSFACHNPVDGNGYARGRASVQVMEF